MPNTSPERLREALPKQIGRLHLGDKPNDSEGRLCDWGHEIPTGHPLYWPARMGQHDDTDPSCLAHAIEQTVDEQGWPAQPLTEPQRLGQEGEAYGGIGKEKCSCGHRACSTWWLTGIGSFCQGSGFSEEEADRIIHAPSTPVQAEPVAFDKGAVVETMARALRESDPERDDEWDYTDQAQAALDAALPLLGAEEREES